MALEPIDFQPVIEPLPSAIEKLLADVDHRIERFQYDRRNTPISGFVPCDFVEAYHAIKTVDLLNLATGGRFLEWGSGFGAVTCLAAKLGWDAIGIEIEIDLVEESVLLAEDHDAATEFVCGSFIPEGGEHLADTHADVAWLLTHGADAYDELGLDLDDFDLVFAYPWPGEEQVAFDIFEEYAGIGSLLLTFHGEQGMQLARKTSR